MNGEPKPPETADLVEAVHRLVGADKARVVQRALGGSRIYVPHTAKQDHWLTQLIGMPGMTRVAAELGGDLVAVPRQETRADLNRSRVLLFSLARLPVSVIALICDLSARHVSSIRAALRDEGELPPASTRNFRKKAST